MILRRRKRPMKTHQRGPGSAANAPTSQDWAKMTDVLSSSSDWERAEDYRYRAQPPQNFIADTDNQQPPAFAPYQRTVEAWNVRPIVGNHWVPVYYRTPPDNLVSDASAHTGSPHVSITDGHYAQFMPPPVNVPVLHASRGQIPYRVPLVQDRGMPRNTHEPHLEQYTPWVFP